MHAVAELLTEKVPAAHGRMMPLAAYEPGGAGVHVALPKAPLPYVEPMPAGHSAHEVAPALENVPAPHCTMDEADAA